MKTKSGNRINVLFLPIFLSVLIILPNVSLAADLQPPSWWQQEERNASYQYNTSVQPFCCPDLTTKMCLTNDTLTILGDQKLSQYVGLDSNGNPVFNVIDYVSTTYKYCPDGCSFTLQDCRWSLPYQYLALILLMVALGAVSVWAYDLGSMGMVAGCLSFIFALLLATWDVFTGNLALFAEIMPFVFIIFFAFNWRTRMDMEKDEDE